VFANWPVWLASGSVTGFCEGPGLGFLVGAGLFEGGNDLVGDSDGS
jgi:hypothetical protein